MKGKETLREIEFAARDPQNKRPEFRSIKRKVSGTKADEHFKGKNQIHDHT